MFKELTEKLSYPAVEEAILRFWKDDRTFEKSISADERRPGFTFYEGPPTANGRPGIHHVMSRTLKDLVCRYKTMRGFRVHRKAGWDTHGLPVEIEVEKQLGFKHKDDILRYGIAEFNAKCRASVWKYKADWERMTELMGYWVDLSQPYITFENSYIESVWWALQQFYRKGLIYQGHKIQPYCPRCETPLSSHEVSLGYEDVKDPSVYVKLAVRGQPNTFFLVWTTTPWTLISNVALAIAPNVDYVKVEHKGESLILAAARLPILESEYTIVARMQGSQLVGLEYERLFTYHPVDKKGFRVVAADFVTVEDGTGIVHMAPAYGEDDHQTAKKYDLPTIHPVNGRGEFGNEVTEFAGKFVKEADPLIIQYLRAKGLLYKKETITHSYPHCWRCKTPLLYYARESWYIKTTAYARRMIELNRQINWVPPEVGEGRFGNWLEENKDWALSRDRFWGTPLPIWICESCKTQRCVGSIAELREGQNLPDPLDLHRPFVDAVTFACSCGGTMRRTPELIDVWFDSGAMPFAQWHYPFEHKELIDGGEQYPADYICEGIDQTRGWFYSLHAIGTFLFDQPAYKNLIVNELILDKDAQKMSKSKGNTVDPFAILSRYGADTTRWFLVTTSPPWRPTMFDEEGLGEVQRKFFGTLVNTYAFFALYANIDRFSYSEPRVSIAERPEFDRWILSALNSLVKRYCEYMDAYDVTKAARLVSDFSIDQLSNWYVRRNRRRFWSSRGPAGQSAMDLEKLTAYQTLYECLICLTKLMAPFAPFLAEELYRNLNTVTRREASESVHLTQLPQADESAIDRPLEVRMERAERIVMLVRAMRTRASLKVRQPLRRIILPISSEDERGDLQHFSEVILDEVNVKAMEFVTDESGLVKKRARPNFKSIGPKHGKAVQSVATRIKELSGNEIDQLERAGRIEIPVNGNTVALQKEDVEILREDIAGWLVESDGEMTVALDTQLDEELLTEGTAREFVSRVQNMRKDAGFEVTDRIMLSFSASENLRTRLNRMSRYIGSETLAVGFSDSLRSMPFETTVEINGEEVRIGIERQTSREEKD
jgi:isoleucyl-tRNA synthetase